MSTGQETSALVYMDQKKGTPLLDSRVAARELGIEHRSLKDLIRDHSDALGEVRLETAVSLSPNPETFYVLNERQSLQILVRVKNTEQALKAKDVLVDAFLAIRTAYTKLLRKELDTWKDSYFDWIRAGYDMHEGSKLFDAHALYFGRLAYMLIDIDKKVEETP